MSDCPITKRAVVQLRQSDPEWYRAWSILAGRYNQKIVVRRWGDRNYILERNPDTRDCWTYLRTELHEDTYWHVFHHVSHPRFGGKPVREMVAAPPEWDPTQVHTDPWGGLWG